MKVTASQSENGVVVATLSGRVDSVNATEFEQELSRAMGGSNRLVVDCADLVYISSAGLRILLLAVKRTRSQGGGVALCRVRDHVREVLEVSGFTRIMTVCDTLASAVDSF